jgi:hypothetical protein
MASIRACSEEPAGITAASRNKGQNRRETSAQSAKSLYSTRRRRLKRGGAPAFTTTPRGSLI